VAGEAFKKSREAAVELIAARKLEEKRRKELRAEFDRWEARVREAEARGDSAATAEAMGRCEEIADRDAAAKAQIFRLQKELALAEAQLRTAAVRESMSVDADALLSSLEAATGAADPEKREIEKLDQEARVEQELERLKRALGEEGR
jgi:phage shock protein A